MVSVVNVVGAGALGTEVDLSIITTTASTEVTTSQSERVALPLWS